MLFGEVDQFAECRFVGDGHLGQTLAVEVDGGFFESADKLGIGHIARARGGVDAGDPQSAEVAFAAAAVAVGVLVGAHDCLFGDAIDIVASPAESARAGNQRFVAAAGGDAAFDSGHGGGSCWGVVIKKSGGQRYGARRLMRLASAPVTTASSVRRRRLRAVDFLVMMWRQLARARAILPLPVRRNRLAALLLVFILGMVSSFLFAFGDEEHREAFADQIGALFDVRVLLQVGGELVQALEPDFLLGNLAPAKPHRHLDAVAGGKEALGVAQLDGVVRVGDDEVKFNLFDLRLFLSGFCLMAFFVLVVEMLAIVQNFANDGVGQRRNFNQVHVLLVRALERVGERQQPGFFAAFINQQNFRRGDVVVDPQI